MSIDLETELITPDTVVSIVSSNHGAQLLPRGWEVEHEEQKEKVLEGQRRSAHLGNAGQEVAVLIQVEVYECALTLHIKLSVLLSNIQAWRNYVINYAYQELRSFQGK